MLSNGKKRYLFVIYELAQNGGGIRSKEIASSLHIKAPSISKMLNSMVEDGLIEKEYYGMVHLTPKGLCIANRLYTDYLLLYFYFSNCLQVEKQDAREDAISCLCVFSKNSIKRMTDLSLRILR